jgi:hypothetical protein
MDSLPSAPRGFDTPYFLNYATMIPCSWGLSNVLPLGASSLEPYVGRRDLWMALVMDAGLHVLLAWLPRLCSIAYCCINCGSRNHDTVGSHWWKSDYHCDQAVTLSGLVAALTVSLDKSIH